MKKLKRTRKPVKSNRVLNSLTIMNPNSAGVDIGSRYHWVAVSPHLTKDNIRKYSTFTESLHDICKWLKKCKVESVCMESTGIYWLPLHELLEKYGFEVYLCNARQAKNLPNRQKTDYHDCAWIQKLHSYGLLTNSFIPNLAIRDFRNLMRFREKMTNDRSRIVQRMQKTLTQMNILLSKVLADITGQTGMAIIKSIISGNTDPKKLLKLKNPRVFASDDVFLKALNGNYDNSLIKLLDFHLQQYEFTCSLIAKVDKDIEIYLSKIHLDNPKNSSEITGLSEKDLLITITGVDLTEVPGFDVLSIRKLISETGLDMTKWKNSKHFTSWLRLAPNSKISGDKILSSKTIRHKPKAAKIFRMCASSLRSSKSYLGDFFRRKKAHKSFGHAVTATARKLAVIFYHMLKYKTTYHELGESHYTINHKYRSIRHLRNYAKKLGYSIVKNED